MSNSSTEIQANKKKTERYFGLQSILNFDLLILFCAIWEQKCELRICAFEQHVFKLSILWRLTEGLQQLHGRMSMNANRKEHQQKTSKDWPETWSLLRSRKKMVTGEPDKIACTLSNRGVLIWPVMESKKKLTIIRKSAGVGKCKQHVQHWHDVRQLVEAVDVLVDLIQQLTHYSGVRYNTYCHFT